MENDLLYYLAFSHCLGIGPVKLAALLNHFGKIKKAYLADKKELQQLLGLRQADKFLKFRSEFDPVKKLEELTKKQIDIVPISHRAYPQQLRNISDPPICLYIKGNGIKILNQTQADGKKTNYLFAVVGTRKPTSYGIQIARKFSFELAQSGFIIVSGMAVGIDTVAHEAALETGTKTIAVLGCGVDIIYPPSNSRLYEKIIQTGGLIISEFPPGQLVLKGLFVARNRVISGLSMGVLVVEGAKDSGALITARYAVEQGKEVFAPPAPLTSEMSEAPNLLLKQGAKLVTTTGDILEEFNLRLIPKRKAEIEAELEGEEKVVFSLLKNEPKLCDEVAVQTNLSIDKVLNLFSILEIKGIVEKNSEGKYQLKI